MDTAVLIAVGLLALSNAAAIAFLSISQARLLTTVGKTQRKIYLFCISILSASSRVDVAAKDRALIQDEMKKKGLDANPHERIEQEIEAVARTLNMSRDEALTFIAEQVKKDKS